MRRSGACVRNFHAPRTHLSPTSTTTTTFAPREMLSGGVVRAAAQPNPAHSPTISRVTQSVAAKTSRSSSGSAKKKKKCGRKSSNSSTIADSDHTAPVSLTRRVAGRNVTGLRSSFGRVSDRVEDEENKEGSVDRARSTVPRHEEQNEGTRGAYSRHSGANVTGQPASRDGADDSARDMPGHDHTAGHVPSEARNTPTLTAVPASGRPKRPRDEEEDDDKDEVSDDNRASDDGYAGNRNGRQSSSDRSSSDAEEEEDAEGGRRSRSRRARAETRAEAPVGLWHTLSSSPRRTRQSRDGAHRVVYYPPTRPTCTSWNAHTTTAIASAWNAASEPAVSQTAIGTDTSRCMPAEPVSVSLLSTETMPLIGQPVGHGAGERERIASDNSPSPVGRVVASAAIANMCGDAEEAHSRNAVDQEGRASATRVRPDDVHGNDTTPTHFRDREGNDQSDTKACTFLRALAFQQHDAAAAVSAGMMDGWVGCSMSSTPARASAHVETTPRMQTCLTGSGTPPARASLSSASWDTTATATAASSPTGAAAAAARAVSSLAVHASESVLAMTAALANESTPCYRTPDTTVPTAAAATVAEDRDDYAKFVTVAEMASVAQRLHTALPEDVLFSSQDAHDEDTSSVMDSHTNGITTAAAAATTTYHTIFAMGHGAVVIDESGNSNCDARDVSGADHRNMGQDEDVKERDDDLAREVAEDVRMSADIAFTPDTGVADTNPAEWLHSSSSSSNNNNNNNNSNHNSNSSGTQPGLLISMRVDPTREDGNNNSNIHSSNGVLGYSYYPCAATPPHPDWAADEDDEENSTQAIIPGQDETSCHRWAAKGEHGDDANSGKSNKPNACAHKREKEAVGISTEDPCLPEKQGTNQDGAVQHGRVNGPWSPSSHSPASLLAKDSDADAVAATTPPRLQGRAPAKEAAEEDEAGMCNVNTRSPSGRPAGRTVFRLVRTHDECEEKCANENNTTHDNNIICYHVSDEEKSNAHVENEQRSNSRSNSAAPVAAAAAEKPELPASSPSCSATAVQLPGASKRTRFVLPTTPATIVSASRTHEAAQSDKQPSLDSAKEAGPTCTDVTFFPSANATTSVSICANVLTALPVVSPMQPGTFYDLPLRVGELFASLRGVRTLFDWQQHVLQREDVRRGSNFVYSLPTSGGKTLVAEIILLRGVLLQRRSCFFVLPFVSLAEEKATALKPFAAAFDFTVDGHYGMTGSFPLPRGPTVFVCTIEKANSVLNHLLDENAVHEIGTVVVDELHMLGEPRRGATLELFLSKLLWVQRKTAATTEMNTNANAATTSSTSPPLAIASAESSVPFEPHALQIVGMSATVPNLAAIARWLGAAYFESTHRPVPLQHYSVVDGMVLRDGKVNERNLAGTTESEWLCELATELPEASVLIFCASRQQCVQTARTLVHHLQLRATRTVAAATMEPDELSFHSALSGLNGSTAVDIDESNSNSGDTGEGTSNNGGRNRDAQAMEELREAEAALHSMLADSGVVITSTTVHALRALPRRTAAGVGLLLTELAHLSHHEAAQLSELVPFGVAFHHGGLLSEERDLIERAYRARHVRWLCCTSTLAAGVNLPARRVILKTPFIGRDFLTKSRYMQMCGRAGRAGLDECGESFLLLRPRDRSRGLALMHCALEPCSSQMLEEFGGFMRALLECVGVRLVDSVRAARGWVQCLLGPHAPGPVEHAVKVFLNDAPPDTEMHTSTLDTSNDCDDNIDSNVDHRGTRVKDAESMRGVNDRASSTTTTTNNNNANRVCSTENSNSNVLTGLTHECNSIKDCVESKEDEQEELCLTESCMSRLLARALNELVRCELVRRGGEGGRGEGGGSWVNSFVTTAASVTILSNSEPPVYNHTTKSNSTMDGGNHADASDDGVEHYEEDVRLQTTPFGASAVRSCFSVEEALVVRDEFNQLRHTGLILADDLHLSYFLTPLREVGNCDWAHYRRILGRLSDTRQHIANLIGVDERFVHQRAMGLCGDSDAAHAAPTSEHGKRIFFIARRFYVALMLADVLAEVPLEEVEQRYHVSRGQLQSLMRSASMFSGSMTSFCHAMEWYALEAVLASFVKRLDFGVKPDLVPLMEIRGVQPARARALWVAGFRDAKSIATAEVDGMVQRVKAQNAPECKSAKYFTRRSALALIRRATAYLQEQIKRRRGDLDALAEETRTTTTTTHGHVLS